MLMIKNRVARSHRGIDDAIIREHTHINRGIEHLVDFALALACILQGTITVGLLY